MKYFALVFLPVMFVVMPYVAGAQQLPPPNSGQSNVGSGGAAGGTTIETIITSVLNLLNSAVPILIALAIVLFFWGLAKFMLSAGDTAQRSSGISLMIWGVIALFVMVSVWGLVSILQNTLNVGAGGGAITPGVIFRP